MSHPIAVIILAAGQGTRMKSPLPKILHPLAGRALIEHALEAARQVHPRHLGIVVRHQRQRVVDHLQERFCDLIFIDQDDIPGTGRAVQCAVEELNKRGVTSGTVLVTSGDVPLLRGESLEQLFITHTQANAAVTLLTTLVPDASGYGRIVRQDGEVKAIVEHRDANAQQLQIREINAGIYAFDLKFLNQTLPQLGQENTQGEVYLTDTVAVAVSEGMPVKGVILEDSWQAQGCNDPQQLADLETQYWLRQGSLQNQSTQNAATVANNLNPQT